MDGDGATHGERIRRRLGPSLAVGLAFVALEAGALPLGKAQWASNLLQLALAAAAALSCFRAAARERALARSFFVLIGLGMALWALAQGLWTLGALGRSFRLLIVFQDLLFVSCAAPLIAACVVKPDRPRAGALGLAADVGLVSVLALFVYVYFPVARAAVGYRGPLPGPGASAVQPAAADPARSAALAAARLRWRVAAALPGARARDGGLSRRRDALQPGCSSRGTYRPGLHDLPWALPFLWVALAAREWPAPRDEAAAPAQTPGRRQGTGDWRARDRATSSRWPRWCWCRACTSSRRLLGSPTPELHALRGRIALVGTLLVGGLYLARQLYILRSAEATQRAREERFRALVENSADAIGVLDRAGASAT